MKKHHVLLTKDQVKQLQLILNDERVSQTVKNRCHILLNLNENQKKHMTELEAAKKSGANISTVGNVLRLYSKGGVDAVIKLRRHPNSNTARCIGKKKEKSIIRVIQKNPPKEHSYWTYRLLAKTIAQETGVPVGYTTIRRFLIKELGAMHTYRVGDHSFAISIDATADVFRYLYHYQLFYDNTDVVQEPLFNLRITKMASIRIPDYITHRKDKVCFTDGNRLCFVARNDEGNPIAILLTDTSFHHGTLAITKHINPWLIKQNIIRMYSMCVTPKDTLILHAAVVEYNGKGYLFMGNSGTGKSTHSRLWTKHISGARVINDDQPVIRIHPDGTSWVYGTPWGGKKPVYCNVKLPIGGIIQLEQAPSNEIRQEKRLEAYSHLWDALFNRYSMEQTDILHNTITKLMSSVTIWHLNCLPNKEAAILCCKTVTKKKKC